MPPRPTPGTAPQRRRLLLETAAAEFARAGYERASLNAVIRACGMSKSSFYHHFGAKARLFDTVISEFGSELLRRLDPPAPEVLRGPHFWARIEALVGRLERLGQEPWTLDLGRLFYLPDAPAGSEGSLARAEAAIQGWLVRTLVVGRECGQVRGDLPASLQADLAMAVLRAMDRWALRHAADADSGTREQILAAQMAALRRLLGS
ncbi:MAG: TetR/AcrR family transcriptional regulator [Chloroflexota bacterium]